MREELMPDCLATAIYRYKGVFLILDTQDLDAKIKEPRVQTRLCLAEKQGIERRERRERWNSEREGERLICRNGLRERHDFDARS